MSINDELLCGKDHTVILQLRLLSFGSHDDDEGIAGSALSRGTMDCYLEGIIKVAHNQDRELINSRRNVVSRHNRFKVIGSRLHCKEQ